MESKYRDTSDTILRFREHKDSLVRRTVIFLCPTMAAFDPDAFVGIYLGICMTYLLGQLRRDKDRSSGEFF